MFHVSGHAGKIVYPWNSTSAIVKTGNDLDIMFQANAGEQVQSVELRGPYNTVAIAQVKILQGSWVYDKMSGNTYNTQIIATVPLNAPEELYDLVVTTSTGNTMSRSSVKVIRDYRKNFTFVQFSDTHMGRNKFEDYPIELAKLSKMIEVINIISPDLAFMTGDLVDATPNVVDNFPGDQKRWDFFYEGYRSKGILGVYDVMAPVFALPGNHDYQEYEFPGSSQPGHCREKADFWNRYNGLQSQHFQYGEAQFFTTNNSWTDCSSQEQIDGHNEWLKKVGPGKLKVIAKHMFGHSPEEAQFTNQHNIRMGLAGHNHHIGPESPHREGVTDMYIVNWIHHMTFSVFNVDSNMNVQYLHNKVAVENPYDEDPRQYRPQLALTFAGKNDGSVSENTATVTNKLDIGFDRTRIRFVMAKGSYAVSNGTIEQIINNDTVSVVDVRVPVKAKSIASVKITRTGPAGIKSHLLEQIKIRTEVSPGKMNIRFPLRKPSVIVARLHNLDGALVLETQKGRIEAGDHNLQFGKSELGSITGGVYFLNLQIREEGSSAPISKTVRVVMP